MEKQKRILSPAEQAKRKTKCYRITSLVFFLLAIAAPVGVLVFSFTTITSTTELADGTTILNGKNPQYDEDPCAKVEKFRTNQPLRFSFGNESDTLSCSWPVLNTIFHIGLGFLGIAAVIVSFIFTFFYRRPLMYLFDIIIIVIGCGFGYVGYDDSHRIYNSLTWCNAGMGDVPWTKKPSTIECEYAPLILVPVLDFIAAVVCILLSVFAVCFVCRAGPVEKGKRDRLLPDDNDRDDDQEPDNPFEKPSRDRKDPRDTFGETEEDDEPKSKSRGGLFGRFGGGGKKSREPDVESGHVNFEQESSSRFAPMSKTDREAKDKPLGSIDYGSNSSNNVGNALFNFDEVQSEEEQKKSSSSSQQPQQQQQTQPQQQPQQQPKPQPKPQPQPQQQNGVIDFEALSGADSNPFA